MLRHIASSLAGVLVTGAAVLGGMVWLGGPQAPPVNQHLAGRDKDIDASLGVLPGPESFTARDGTRLAFRRYPGAPGGGIAVLVHGSSGSGVVMHSLGRALAESGVTAIAVDVRGHGGSGSKGDIAHAGQLDDDMADLAALLDRESGAEPRVLAGHSSGGGFVLRVAGSERGCEFDGYVAISPYLNYRASTLRPDAGWAQAGMPRVIALSILDRLRIRAFDGLPVVRFAITPGRPNRTYAYSWRLLQAFGLPMSRWEDRVRAITQPTAVMVGADDDLFFADRFAGVFGALNPKLPVSVTPGVDHMGMVIEPAAIAEDAARIRAMLRAAPRSGRCG